MRLLIDSHVLIWWWIEEDSLSPAVLSLLQDSTNSVAVSAASAWEVATKYRLGKLPQLGTRFADLVAEFQAEVAQDRFDFLAITAAHGLRAGSYDVEHRDPFDRLLAAQAELEGLTLVTRDPAFAAFPCKILW